MYLAIVSNREDNLWRLDNSLLYLASP